MSSLVCLLNFLRVASLPYYPLTSSLVPLGFFRWLSRTSGAYDTTNTSDSGKASASMNAVSRERLVPLDATVGAATPTNLLAAV